MEVVMENLPAQAEPNPRALMELLCLGEKTRLAPSLEAVLMGALDLPADGWGENFPVMQSVGAALVEAGFKSAQPFMGGQERVRKALLSRTRLPPNWDALRKVIFKDMVIQFGKRHGT